MHRHFSFAICYRPLESVDFDLGFLCLEVLGVFLTVPEMISSRAIFDVSTGGSFRTLFVFDEFAIKKWPGIQKQSCIGCKQVILSHVEQLKLLFGTSEARDDACRREVRLNQVTMHSYLQLHLMISYYTL